MCTDARTLSLLGTATSPELFCLHVASWEIDAFTEGQRILRPCEYFDNKVYLSQALARV